jgi:hypothetical protein
MRMLSDALLHDASFMGAPGVEEVKWRRCAPASGSICARPCSKAGRAAAPRWVWSARFESLGAPTSRS